MMSKKEHDQLKKKFINLVKRKGSYKKYSQEQRKKEWDKLFKNSTVRLLKDINLSHSNLEGFKFNNFTCENVKFRGCSLRGAKIIDSTFDKCSFNRANLSDTLVENSDFNHSHLKHVYLKKAKIKECHCDATLFNNGDLTEAEIIESKFENCFFIKSDCIGTKFDNTHLINIDFSKANLKNVVFTKPEKVKNANFKEARNLPKDFKDFAAHKILEAVHPI